MKFLLPFAILVLAVLGCTVPQSKGTDEMKSSQPKPKIVYSKPSIERLGSVGSMMHFEVTNASGRPLEFVQVHASFYDKNGTLVASEHPYIVHYQRLDSGQRSAAEVAVDANSRIARYELTFTANGDEPFEKVDLDASELPSPPDPPKKQRKN